VKITVPFTPAAAMPATSRPMPNPCVLEPKADGFRNHLQGRSGTGRSLLIDKAQLLTLTAPR
jgi:catalase-peroxidase